MKTELSLTFKNWFYAISEAYKTELIAHPNYAGQNFQLFIVHDVPDALKRQIENLGFKYNPEEKSYFIMRKSKFPVRTNLGQGFYGFEDLVRNERWLNATSELGIDTRSIGGRQAQESPVPVMQAPKTEAPKTEAPKTKETKTSTGLSDSCKMILADPEKSKVDAAFAKIVESGRKGHVVINALAGSGKTTTLKCLWEKYGRGSGKKWLYLVFNKRNREEAKQKFKDLEDNIYTTNAFLNMILRSNASVLPATQYSVGSKKDKIEVARDSQEYIDFREDTLLPSVSDAKQALINLRNNRYYKSGIYFIDRQEDVIDDCAQKLADLVKQYGTNPDDDKATTERLDNVMENFDITQDLESHLEFFERTKRNLYGSSLEEFEEIQNAIKQIDVSFNEKKQIIKSLAKWLLQHTAPGHKRLSYEQNKFAKNDRDYDFHQIRDFNDDYWYAGIYADKIKWPKYDVVLADEVQDFNYMQKIMLQKLAENGASVVAVGDPNQALYRFRGAENTSFSDLVDTLQKDHQKTNPDDVVHIAQEMPSNYRSRQNIIDFVNSETKVKNLNRGRDYSKDNPDYHGEVTTTKKPDEVALHIKEKMKNGMLDKSTALLARTNAPLIGASMQLLKNGIPFTVIGKNFASEIVAYFRNLIKELGFDDRTPIDILVDQDQETTGELSKFLNGQKEKFSKKATKKAYLKELQENIDAILNICYIAKEQNPTIRNVSDVINWIYKLFKEHSQSEDDVNTEDLNHVVITTVHKSKGFEFDRVYLLDPSNFPHPRARLQADLDQEENAKYVAYTRAKDELHVIDDKILEM